jgi:hypothetical protein
MISRRQPTRIAARILRAALTLTLVAACGGERSSGDATPATSETPAADAVVESTGLEGVDSTALADARTAADALGKTLMGQMMAALERGGPMEAVGYCADSAQVLTARFATDSLAVGRTALRVRNPANAPDDVERRLLAYLGERHATGTMPAEYAEVLRAGDGTRTLRYVRPIVLQAGCVRCHGAAEQIDPAVRSVIAERYPADSATGFAEGDLRGIVSVVRTLPAARPE